LDGLGHGQDLLPAWFHVMSLFGVLLEVFDQLVVGIGSDSEATLGTSDFSRHAYRVAKAMLVNLTFVILASQIGICEKRADSRAVLSGFRSFLSWQLSGTGVRYA